MAKINGNEIRTGNVIEHDGGLWVAVRTNHVKPGKGGAYNQVELKNLINGTKLNERFRSAETVEKIRLEQKDFSYLYEQGDALIFMDTESYEQLELQKDFVGDRAPCLLLCDDRLPVALAAGHQCPDHPGGLVGQRNRCNLGCSSRHQLHEPWPPGPVPFGIADDRHCADYEQLSQVAITSLGDAAELLLAPARILLRNKPDPGR